jgi:choice-of-anchor A domain-containing protein
MAPPLFATRLTRPVLEALEARENPSTFDLGVAGQFNGFFFGDFQSQYSDTEGRLAAGGDVSLTGYGLGDKLPNSGGTRDDLVVGGDLNFTNGQVFFGNVAVRGAVNVDSFGLPNGEIKDAIGVNFADAKSDLLAKSAAWADMESNGKVKNEWGTLKLTGNDPSLNVFTVFAGQLARCVGLSVTVPDGAQVLINVKGSTVTMQNFAIWLNGTTKENVLFNLAGAKTLTLNAIGVPGSILAPKAEVDFNNGQVSGTLIGRCFYGNGQLNYVPPPAEQGTAAINGKVCAYMPDGTPLFINNVTMILTGTTNQGAAVHRVVQTGADGFFHVTDLPAGTYTLTTLVPDGYAFDEVMVGDKGGTPNGQSITNIVLHDGDVANGYGFEFTLLN